MDLFEDAGTLDRPRLQASDEINASIIARQRRKDRMIVEASEGDFAKHLPWILHGQDIQQEE